MSEKQMGVYKVTLSTGKTILLREMKIKHQELAAKAVGNKAGDNNMLFATLMQKELLKILLFQINGKVIEGAALEDLDALLSFQEYMQVMKVMGKILGEEADMGNFQIELGTSGGT